MKDKKKSLTKIISLKHFHKFNYKFKLYKYILTLIQVS